MHSKIRIFKLDSQNQKLYVLIQIYLLKGNLTLILKKSGSILNLKIKFS